MGLNVFSNLLGKLSYAVFTMASLPWLISILGVDVYGVVGLYISVTLVVVVVEGGMTSAFLKEVSVFRADAELGCIVASFWRFFFGVTCLVFLLCAVLGFLFMPGFFAGEMGESEVIVVVVLASLGIASQFPVLFYQAGMNGLEAQVVLNVYYFFFALARTLGCVLYLHLVSEAGLGDYFLYQFCVHLVYTLLIRRAFIKSSGIDMKTAEFKKNIISRNIDFSLKLLALSALSALITQADRFSLSRVLPPAEFGYYVVAATVSTLPYIFASAIYSAAYPKFSLMVASGKEEVMYQYYDFGTALLTCLMLPGVGFVYYYAAPYLGLWMGEAAEAAEAGLVHDYLKLLIIGAAFQSLMFIAFAVQLAQGRSDVALKINLILGVGYLFIVFYGAKDFGGEGVCFAWIGYNVTSYLASIFITQKHLMGKPFFAFISKNLLIPLFTTVVIFQYADQYERGGLAMGIVVMAAAISASLLACNLASAKQLLLIKR